MRRTVLYTAGLLFAAGTTLALAGPASAAPAADTKSKCCGSTSSSTPKFTGYSSQWLGQASVTNQTVLNNVGNPQIGLGNYNGGGSASATSYTSQIGGIFGGW
ncbi:MAG TPA: hypothetical protein VGB74_16900 [Actinoplanes sp.]